jgi:hypothetical protein
MARIDSFYGLRNRRPTRDWDVDADSNSIAPDSSFMTDQDRVKTESRWVENPKWTKAAMKQKKSGKFVPLPMSSGKMVDQKASLMRNVKQSMGGVIRGTIYDNPPKRQNREEW